jgi:hypothetical protein
VISSRSGGLADLEQACVSLLQNAGRQLAWIAAAPREVLSRDAVDFVLDFSSDASAVFDLSPLRYGRWRFEFDEGVPPGWRAMTAGRRSTLISLIAETHAERVTLHEGALPTSARYRALRARTVDIVSAWPERASREIDLGGWSHLPRRSTRPQPFDEVAPWWARCRWALVAPAFRAWRWWREMARYDTWNVGIAVRATPLKAVEDLQRLSPVRWLPERPPRYFLADPFPYRANGRTRLLVEEYGHPRGVRGRIASVDVDRESTFPRPVISRRRHISYPYTFEYDDRTCCAIEMSQEDGCAVYELGDDDRWRERYRLLRGHRVIDPTLLHTFDRWWLFCTDTCGRGSVRLHAFHADRIEGPWTPHALNPLKTDLRSARPAGRPFRIGERLFRPAQDCSRTYGGAINVMEIVELTPTRFRESCATRLEADRDWPYPDGMHTIVVEDDAIYFDAKRERYDYLLWLKNLPPSRL